MRLIHYSPFKIAQIEDTKQDERKLFSSYNKPHGLWLSDEDDYGWGEWCKAENYRLDRLTYQYAISVTRDANILYILTVKQLDDFTVKYGYAPEKVEIVPEISGELFDMPEGINWKKVAEDYDGIVITPYQWERRMTQSTNWYYGWDCASGCIWNAKAIGGIVDVTAKGTKSRKSSVASRPA